MGSKGHKLKSKRSIMYMHVVLQVSSDNKNW